MQLEAYTFPSSARPIKEALEAWEQDAGVTLGVTNCGDNLHRISECDVKFVIGNLPADSEGVTFQYHTFYHANVGEFSSAQSGWEPDSMSNYYDVTAPTQRQLDALPDPSPLGWVGTYSPNGAVDGPREVLPLWYANDETNTLYFITQANFVYMDPALVTDMLDHMLLNLAAPEERAARAQQRAMDTLTKYFAEGATADLSNLRDDIGNDIRTLNSHERMATQLRDRLREKQQRLDLLIKQSGAHDAAKAAAEAFEAMGHHGQIDSVKFAGTKLTVQTTGLDIEHPVTGQTAYLGQFTITLDIQSGGITVKNNDNPRNGYDHPHVFIGSPCFGEMDSTIMELTRAGQLLGAVEMIFVFLSSVNVRDDWGRSLSYWMEGNASRPADELVPA